MGRGLIKFKGKFEKVFEPSEDGTVRALFKNECRHKKLNDSIVMFKFDKKQWKRIKKVENFMEEVFVLDGDFQASVNKDNKPYLYVDCKNVQLLDKDDKTQLTEKQEEFNKPKKQKKNNRWYEQIPQEEFQDIDIFKVRVVEEMHLKGIVARYNLENVNKRYKLSPIAVRQVGEEYELVTGLASYIVARLLPREVKAYITDLDIETFRDKYLID